MKVHTFGRNYTDKENQSQNLLDRECSNMPETKGFCTPILQLEYTAVTVLSRLQSLHAYHPMLSWSQ
jgi:hypothetical protein